MILHKHLPIDVILVASIDYYFIENAAPSLRKQYLSVILRPQVQSLHLYTQLLSYYFIRAAVNQNQRQKVECAPVFHDKSSRRFASCLNAVFMSRTLSVLTSNETVPAAASLSHDEVINSVGLSVRLC